MVYNTDNQLIIDTISVLQFHKGTIKTMCNFAERKEKEKFQFHKGTIKTHLTSYELSAVVNFNSIKVQLKPNTNFPYMGCY